MKYLLMIGKEKKKGILNKGTEFVCIEAESTSMALVIVQCIKISMNQINGLDVTLHENK